MKFSKVHIATVGYLQQQKKRRYLQLKNVRIAL